VSGTTEASTARALTYRYPSTSGALEIIATAEMAAAGFRFFSVTATVTDTAPGPSGHAGVLQVRVVSPR
jgi:hypothetical protein